MNYRKLFKRTTTTLNIKPLFSSKTKLKTFLGSAKDKMNKLYKYTEYSFKKLQYYGYIAAL